MRFAVLVAALAAASVLGLAACGGDDSATTTTTVEEPATTAHVLAAAESGGPVGPSLDERLVVDAAEADVELTEYVRAAIVDPDGYIATGYQAGVMPDDYGERLSPQQLSDLVAFVVQSVQ